jgi:hypothetical protein
MVVSAIAFYNLVLLLRFAPKVASGPRKAIW